MVIPKKRLGNSDMVISRVGIGTAPIGSTRDWKIYWGEMTEETAVEAIHAALEVGVNWIDTAPMYGWGRAERIVGSALKGRRDDVFIFTKCGTIRGPEGNDFMDLRPETIRREVEESLQRLQTDHIDLYQMHDVDPKTPIEDSWREIYSLIDEGKVRYAGISNHPLDLVEKAMKTGAVTSLQERYNPLRRDAEAFFPFARKNNVGLLSWGSLAEGFLADGFDLDALEPDDFRRTGLDFGQRENYEKIKGIRGRLSEQALSLGLTMVSLVVAWELSHPELTGAILGIRNRAEAKAMAEAAAAHLSQNDIETFEAALSDWNA